MVNITGEFRKHDIWTPRLLSDPIWLVVLCENSRCSRPVCRLVVQKVLQFLCRIRHRLPGTFASVPHSLYPGYVMLFVPVGMLHNVLVHW